MLNQNLEQLFIELNTQANNITHIYLAKNGYMITRSEGALKNINSTAYHSNLAMNSLNYTRTLLLILAMIDHRFNQLCNGLRKLE